MIRLQDARQQADQAGAGAAARRGVRDQPDPAAARPLQRQNIRRDHHLRRDRRPAAALCPYQGARRRRDRRWHRQPPPERVVDPREAQLRHAKMTAAAASPRCQGDAARPEYACASARHSVGDHVVGVCVCVCVCMCVTAVCRGVNVQFIVRWYIYATVFCLLSHLVRCFRNGTASRVWIGTHHWWRFGERHAPVAPWLCVPELRTHLRMRARATVRMRSAGLDERERASARPCSHQRVRQSVLSFRWFQVNWRDCFLHSRGGCVCRRAVRAGGGRTHL